MSDIVDVLKAEANRLDKRAYADRCVGPDCALSSLVAATAVAEIERLRADLEGTARLSSANTDRALVAEARLAEAVEGLKEAREDIDFWSGYASDYFVEKWDLKGTLAKYDALLAKLEAPR